jgi:hypothetical protein
MNANAGRFAAARADQLDFGHWKGRFNFDPTGLAGSAALDVLDNDIDAFDNHFVIVDQIDANGAALALVFARDDFDLVASPNLLHRTTNLSSLARRRA